jgi:hypothetical protein
MANAYMGNAPECKASTSGKCLGEIPTQLCQETSASIILDSSCNVPGKWTLSADAATVLSVHWQILCYSLSASRDRMGLFQKHQVAVQATLYACWQCSNQHSISINGYST